MARLKSCTQRQTTQIVCPCTCMNACMEKWSEIRKKKKEINRYWDEWENHNLLEKSMVRIESEHEHDNSDSLRMFNLIFMGNHQTIANNHIKTGEYID